MKKITLNESDLLKIVNKVLNEQKDRQFDEDEIEFLYFIFERELKPPFRKAKQASRGFYRYYNRDGKVMGYLYASHAVFDVTYDPFMSNIRDKVCQVFGFSYETADWWMSTEHHLKSWLGNQINAELEYVAFKH